MKKVILFPIIIIVAAFGLWLSQAEEKAGTQNQVQNVNDQTAQIIKPEPAPQKEEFDPISLPTLMQKEFDGKDLILGNVLDDNSIYTRYFITYKSGQLSISGIMNVPKGPVPQGGFPVLILNHGHIDTAIYTNGRGLKREQDYLVRQGFAIIHPDYRNHAQSSKDPNNETNIRLGYVEDVINAVYAVKNSSLNFLSKDKIGMIGHSMGGGITQSVLVTKPNLIKAAVLYAPVSMDARDSFERWTKTRAEIAAQIVEIHGSPTTSPEFWKNVSAVSFINNISVPIQIYHGDKDDSVPLAWSQSTLQLLKAANKNVELIIYPGQPHEFTPPTWNRFMEGAAAFFKANL